MNYTKYFIMSFCLLLCFCSTVKAQNENDSLCSEQTTVIESVKIVSIDSLSQPVQVIQESNLVDSLSNTIINLKGELYSKEQEIAELKKRISKLEDKLVFADSIVARVSNDCLRKKYDKAKVDDALVNFDQMYSKELQSKFSPLKTLLNNYGQYTNELTAIFSAAEMDKDITNPFTGQKVAMAYIEKIKATQYYRNVYNQNWTIPYLNSLIDKAIERIQTFNPKEQKPIQLLELMK